jgi:aminopeptidase N
VIVKQTQQSDKVFQLPVAVDVWNGGNKTRYNVWVDNKADTFTFAAPTRPDLVNFDADKTLLAQKTENKSLDEYTHQYRYGNYLDRREAVDAALKAQDQQKAVALLTMAMNDKYHGLRSYTISNLDLTKQPVRTTAEPVLAKLAQSDPKRLVKAAAIGRLGEYFDAKYIPLFKSAINDSSYSVAGNALAALSELDSVQAYNEAKRLAAAPVKGKLADAITQSMIKYGDESAADLILTNFENMPLSQAKLDAMMPLVEFLVKVKSTANFKRGIDAISEFVPQLPENVRGQVEQYVNMIYANLKKAKLNAGLKEQADYIDTKLNKKGF